MTVIERPPITRLGAGPLALAAIVTWLVYVLVAGLEGTGQNFVVLGVLRFALLAALIAFAVRAGANTRGLGRAGLGLATVAAALYLVGGAGAVATDGWSYDIFAASAPAEPPWYAYLIGLSGFLFAVGTVLVGIAGRAGGRLAVAVILAGVLFPAVFALEPSLGHAGAHIVWLVPWTVLAVALCSPGREARS